MRNVGVSCSATVWHAAGPRRFCRARLSDIPQRRRDAKKATDCKSVVKGKRVELGRRRNAKKAQRTAEHTEVFLCAMSAYLAVLLSGMLQAREDSAGRAFQIYRRDAETQRRQ